MSLLRQRIMDSAMRFFSEKGYSSTSIQDIANDCGIAKGSLYKFFASKEDLLIEVYDARIQDMYDQAEIIKADPNLSSKEKLIRETLHQFIFFTDFKFSMQEFQGLPLHDEGKFAPFLQRLRANMLHYYTDCLLRAYGQEMEPYIWDLVAVYVGILKQYSIFPMFLNSSLNLEHASLFIVDRMDEMAAGILGSKPQPVLLPSVMNEFVKFGKQGQSVTTDKQIANLLEVLLTTIHELAVPNARRKELLEAALLLQEETVKEEPRRVLIRALLDFLRNQHELISIAGQLSRLLD
ncbi:TetR/AcrR family transcriptional regulator [Cohnella silvisoli]|uniref:TetR/AcrR family transcriptional regulator n=1 Tax=Cohnella silvisoli TaxID=2873699 RepID=A0ABV1KTP3_9BACL|nr:TetR/AcrR family transcriptional regulator [Cohnella silvisoli]MCD9022868.1 TetR/AcrR family transcriptional regulator [Cohnella silvisoli]